MRFLTSPFRPSNRFVVTARSRWQPFSCDGDVRSLIGRFGHTIGLGGRLVGPMSNTAARRKHADNVLQSIIERKVPAHTSPHPCLVRSFACIGVGGAASRRKVANTITTVVRCAASSPPCRIPALPARSRFRQPAAPSAFPSAPCAARIRLRRCPSRRSRSRPRSPAFRLP